MSKYILIVATSSYSKDAPLLKSSHEVSWAVLFAVETAMRLGEIVSIRWSDVYLDDMYIHYQTLKIG